MRPFSLSINLLSPVHVGCGQDFDPTNYVESEEALYHFGVDALLPLLSPKDMSELRKASMGNNPLPDVKKIINQHKDKLMQLECVQKIPKLPYVLPERVRIQRVERCAFDPFTQRAILPGSSIKGALRTAWLDANKDLLNIPIERDPFSLLKIGDAMSKDAKHLISYLNRPHKGPLRGVNPGTPSSVRYDYLIEILSRQSRFSGEMVMVDRHPRRNVHAPVESLSALISAANAFYRPQIIKTVEYLREMNKAGIAFGKKWIGFIEKNLVQTTRETVDPNTGEKKQTPTLGWYLEQNKACILRVGKHGGAESLTLSNRRINTRYGGFPHTHTMTLTSTKADEDAEPFGWIFVLPKPINGQ